MIACRSRRASFQASNDAVKSAVASNMDRIGSRVFWPKEGAPEYALGLSLAALRERFFEQAYKSKAARIQTERVRARVRICPFD